MKYGIKNEKILTSEEVLAILHRSAVRYSEYADTTLLFLFREKKTEGYNFYEVRFGKHNFMHLAGMKSEMFNAVEFYEACLNGMVTQKACTPRRDRKTMYSKLAVLEQMLDLRNSKCYKIGEKDLVTRENDFEMATGNANGVIGYDARIKIKESDKVDRAKAAIPTTLLNAPITAYCSRPDKIMFILQKSDRENTYRRLFYEIKKGLFQTEKERIKEQLKIDL